MFEMLLKKESHAIFTKNHRKGKNHENKIQNSYKKNQKDLDQKDLTLGMK